MSIAKLKKPCLCSKQPRFAGLILVINRRRSGYLSILVSLHTNNPSSSSSSSRCACDSNTGSVEDAQDGQGTHARWRLWKRERINTSADYQDACAGSLEETSTCVCTHTQEHTHTHTHTFTHARSHTQTQTHTNTDKHTHHTPHTHTRTHTHRTWQRQAKDQRQMETLARTTSTQPRITSTRRRRK
jgi:hypothetical protein